MNIKHIDLIFVVAPDGYSNVTNKVLRFAVKKLKFYPLAKARCPNADFFLSWSKQENLQ
jgi:hypothetical protein